MEIYELPITTEESRNYHQFFYELKALKVVDWMKAYISTIFYIVILALVLSFISNNILLVLWYKTNVLAKIAFFLVLLIGAALQRSKTIQLKAMMEKYLVQNVPQEFINGRVQLKKVKVLHDRIQVYYRRIND